MNASSFRTPTLLAAAATFASCLLADAARAGSNDHPTHTWFEGSKREWAVDASRLLVRFAPDASQAARALAFERAGLELTADDPSAIAPWRLVGVGGLPVDAAALGLRVDRLLEEDALDYVSPVFRGALPDTWVAFPPEILMQLNVEFVAAAEVELARLAPDLELLEAEFGGLPGAFRLRSAARSGFEVLRIADRLATDSRVAFAEPDAIFTGHQASTPNDPGFTSLWSMRNPNGFDMNGDAAWNVTIGSAAVPVLIIDTGVELSHPDLLVGGGNDFTSSPGFPLGSPANACDNHGTAVAGCVSAIINNGLGTVGIAPGCPSYSARTFISSLSCNGSWTSTASWTVNALAWGASVGCRVSNNSNSYGFTSGAIANQYNATRNAGMVHCASAGNTGVSGIAYPSSLPSVLSVTAMDSFGGLAFFSSFGTGVALTAPGVNIYSTDRTGSAGYSSLDYTFVSGTSFASPYTAGVAALVLSQSPTLSAPAVEARLFSTARDLGAAGYDTLFGNGLVQAYAAIEPSGVASYGTGSNGCIGPETMSANVPPVIGTAGFNVYCNAAPPLNVGILMLSQAQDLAGSDPFGWGPLFHVGLSPLPAQFNMVSDANGDAVLNLPIPNSAPLIGVTFYTQVAWGWPAAFCTPTAPYGLSTSNALAVTIQ